jgi:hypothetical protein
MTSKSPPLTFAYHVDRLRLHARLLRRLLITVHLLLVLPWIFLWRVLRRPGQVLAVLGLFALACGFWAFFVYQGYRVVTSALSAVSPMATTLSHPAQQCVEQNKFLLGHPQPDGRPTELQDVQKMCGVPASDLK